MCSCWHSLGFLQTVHTFKCEIEIGVQWSWRAPAAPKIMAELDQLLFHTSEKPLLSFSSSIAFVEWFLFSLWPDNYLQWFCTANQFTVCWCFHLEICLYWMSPYWFQNVYPTFGNVFPSLFSVVISPLQILPTFCSDLHWIFFVLFCFILCFTTSINSKMHIKPDTGNIVLGLHLFCV